MQKSAAVKALCAVFFLFIPLFMAAHAGEVTLRMKGGGFTISGDLKAFDGSTYIIKSPELGLLEIKADHYTCEGIDCPGTETVRPSPGVAATASVDPGVGPLGSATFIGGSAIGSQYMPELIESYAASSGLLVEKSVAQDVRDLVFSLKEPNGQPAGRVAVLRRGVPAGFGALLSGEADLVWTSRTIKDDEAAQFQAQGLDMRSSRNEHVFALDALVVLVHKSNPVISLPVDRIAQIFAGEIRDWSELGRSPGPINVYAPIEGMGTWSAFETTLLSPRGLTLRADAKRLPTAVEWSDAVAADPDGIGINMIAYIRDTKPLNIQQSCGLISRPTVFSAKTEEFPLSRRLYFYTRGRPGAPIARELLDFALSPKAQDALRNALFVDQRIEALPFREQGSRIAFALNAQDEDFRLDVMRDLIADLSSASRLSTTFRFGLGSAFLDPKGVADVRRLAAELGKPEYAGRTVMLIGFTDSLGNFEVNREVALARAQTVAQALQQAGFRGAVAKAYGELAPVACNDTPASRYLNRRVEVWIK